ncbi:hypothetical protein [Runella aurantiaca]|uniref:Uncharacterized protein n=1 Tax=Runella aurantiaca TaxID=2282308 RepID=A0A369I6J8_9BACT|nr:hypothetical protein [Runella aurantiaca]RDB02296.1 hypothetical protein DVG78_29525 [Runella aurantiaca]
MCQLLKDFKAFWAEIDEKVAQDKAAQIAKAAKQAKWEKERREWLENVWPVEQKKMRAEDAAKRAALQALSKEEEEAQYTKEMIYYYTRKHENGL